MSGASRAEAHWLSEEAITVNEKLRLTGGKFGLLSLLKAVPEGAKGGFSVYEIRLASNTGPLAPRQESALPTIALSR